MANETSEGKIYATFTIDKDIKKKFKMSCTTLNMNMSEVVEAMMENFLDISESLIEKEKERLNSLKQLDNEIEVVTSTRLE